MGRLKNINDKASEIAKVDFENRLKSGAWSEIEYKQEEGEYGLGTSFLMVEYTVKWSQFCKAIHTRLVSAGYEFGLWQNARNQTYLDKVREIASSLTVAEVDVSDRFQTMFG